VNTVHLLYASQEKASTQDAQGLHRHKKPGDRSRLSHDGNDLRNYKDSSEVASAWNGLSSGRALGMSFRRAPAMSFRRASARRNLTPADKISRFARKSKRTSHFVVTRTPVNDYETSGDETSWPMSRPLRSWLACHD